MPALAPYIRDLLDIPLRVPEGVARRPARPPAPSHRHGTPSGPWPFVDIDDEVDQQQVEDPESHRPMSGAPCEHHVLAGQEFCWCKYPQSMYPNWTPRQQKKSKISKVIERHRTRCLVYYVDVGGDGRFHSMGEPKMVDSANLNSLASQWNLMTSERPEGSRARVIFLDNLTGPILQMMGTRYNIEPFFFSSTIGWIPSRFQSHVRPHSGDHITITLSFVRGIKDSEEDPLPVGAHPPTARSSVTSFQTQATGVSRMSRRPDLMIDTQAPLPLRSLGVNLHPDFLSLHMIRSLDNGSTIISSHSGRDNLTSTASVMHERFLLTGKSVYWSSIFKKTKDATFLLLSILWYVMYCWDEVFENLYNHICHLESQVLETNELTLTRELHAIRAHLMHYESLLEDFKKTVEFVQNTPNPGLETGTTAHPQSPGYSQQTFHTESAREETDLLRKTDRSQGHTRIISVDSSFSTSTSSESELKEANRSLLRRECQNLLRDITRLERSRVMQDKRLKNVMDLSFSSINIEDSKRMQKLTQAAVRDSAAMKQIAYLTMVFLPSSFVAAAFGMNIVEINPNEAAPSMTLAKYIAVALPLTFVTIWIVVAFQIQIEDSQANYEHSLHEGSDGSTELRLPTQSSWQSEVAQQLQVGKKYRKLGMFSRLLWPFFLVKSMIERRKFVEKARKAAGNVNSPYRI